VDHSAIEGVHLLWKYLWKETTSSHFWLHVLTCSGSSPGSFSGSSSGTFYPQDVNAHADADAHVENGDANPLLPQKSLNYFFPRFCFRIE
jgi:hypothetical protein